MPFVAPLPVLRGKTRDEILDPLNQWEKFFNELPDIRYTVRSTGAADDQNRVNDAILDMIDRYTGGTIRLPDRQYNFNDSIILGDKITNNFTGISIEGGNGEVGSTLNYSNQKSFIVNSTTDVFTSNGHGYADLTPVMFLSSSALPGGLSSLIKYYVRDSTTNTFSVSLTPGGAALNITSSGSGTLFVQRVDKTALVIWRGRFNRIQGLCIQHASPFTGLGLKRVDCMVETGNHESAQVFFAGVRDSFIYGWDNGYKTGDPAIEVNGSCGDQGYWHNVGISICNRGFWCTSNFNSIRYTHVGVSIQGCGVGWQSDVGSSITLHGCAGGQNTVNWFSNSGKITVNGWDDEQCYMQAIVGNSGSLSVKDANHRFPLLVGNTADALYKLSGPNYFKLENVWAGPGGVVEQTVTADASTDVLTTPADHQFILGSIVRLRSTLGLPGGLAQRTNYYVRDVTATTFKLAATDGGAAINLTTAGTGTMYVAPRPPHFALLQGNSQPDTAPTCEFFGCKTADDHPLYIRPDSSESQHARWKTEGCYQHDNVSGLFIKRFKNESGVVIWPRRVAIRGEHVR